MRYKFSKRSESNLMTCHPDLITLFREVLIAYDCTIICGHRNKEDQEKAFMGKKSLLRYPKSKHNKIPSLAVDVAPYPIDWDDIQRFKDFASHVKAVRNRLTSEKKISSLILWGGDWDTFKDYPHWEIKK